METIVVWNHTSEPPPTPSCKVNGEMLKHVQTSTSQYRLGFLWWKRDWWKHEFGYRSELELMEDVAVGELMSDASICLVSDSQAMPSIPPAPVGFEFTFADMPVQIMRDKWVHRFHYQPTSEAPVSVA